MTGRVREIREPPVRPRRAEHHGGAGRLGGRDRPPGAVVEGAVGSDQRAVQIGGDELRLHRSDSMRWCRRRSGVGVVAHLIAATRGSSAYSGTVSPPYGREAVLGVGNGACDAGARRIGRAGRRRTGSLGERRCPGRRLPAVRISAVPAPVPERPVHATRSLESDRPAGAFAAGRDADQHERPARERRPVRPGRRLQPRLGRDRARARAGQRRRVRPYRGGRRARHRPVAEQGAADRDDRRADRPAGGAVVRARRERQDPGEHRSADPPGRGPDRRPHVRRRAASSAQRTRSADPGSAMVRAAARQPSAAVERAGATRALRAHLRRAGEGQGDPARALRGVGLHGRLARRHNRAAAVDPEPGVRAAGRQQPRRRSGRRRRPVVHHHRDEGVESPAPRGGRDVRRSRAISSRAGRPPPPAFTTARRERMQFRRRRRGTWRSPRSSASSRPQRGRRRRRACRCTATDCSTRTPMSKIRRSRRWPSVTTWCCARPIGGA